MSLVIPTHWFPRLRYYCATVSSAGAEGGTRVAEISVDSPTVNPCQNSTDEEKLLSTQRGQLPVVTTPEQRQAAFSLENRYRWQDSN